jgi:hypothetical protein
VAIVELKQLKQRNFKKELRDNGKSDKIYITMEETYDFNSNLSPASEKYRSSGYNVEPEQSKESEKKLNEKKTYGS